MFGGSLGAISTAADWSDAVLISDEETGEPLDLTGCAITFTVRPVATDCYRDGAYYDGPSSASAVLVGGTSTGEIAIPALGTIEWDFPAPLAMQAGEHRVGIIITRDGDTLQLFLGTVSVEHGF